MYLPQVLSQPPEKPPEGIFLTMHQSSYPAIHGLYKLTNTTVHSAPVYKKMRDSLYLFLDSEHHWEVSPDMGGNNQVLLSIKTHLDLPPHDGWLSHGVPPWSDTGVRLDYLSAAYMTQLAHPAKTIQLLPPAYSDLQDNNILFGYFDLLEETYNDHPQYNSQDYDSVIYLNDFGVWMVGTSEHRNSATPLSLSLPGAASPEVWPEWETVEGGVPEVLELRLVDSQIFGEYAVRGDHAYCLAVSGAIAHGETRSIRCDGLRNCRGGLDEENCPFYASLSWSIVILISCGLTTVAILSFVILRRYKVIHIMEKFLIESTAEEEEMLEDEIVIEALIDKIILSTKSNSLENIQTFDEYFLKIHDSPAGLGLLLGCIFLHVPCPEKRKSLYCVIAREEERLHQGSNMRQDILGCVRYRAGSNQASQDFIQSYQHSNISHTQITRNTRQGIQILVALLTNIIVVKDVFFCLFLLSKYGHLPAFLQGLLNFNMVTIILAQVLKGWSITINYDKAFWIKEKLQEKEKFKLQAGVFLLSPFAPTILPVKQTMMEWNLQKDSNIKESPTRKYKKHLKAMYELKEISHLIQMLRMIESSLETFPQLVMLLTYLLISHNLVFEAETSNEVFIIFNILFSYLSFIISYVHWTDMMKNNKLRLESLFLLFFSAMLITLARLIAVVSVTSSASSEHEQHVILYNFNGSLLEQTRNASNITMNNKDGLPPFVLSLFVPLILHWILLFFFYFFTIQIFSRLTVFDRFLHIFINTFLAIPLRILDDQEQRSKSKEITVNLILLGIENIAMILLGLPSGGISWTFVPFTIGTFSTGFHTAGCILLWWYYKCENV